VRLCCSVTVCCPFSRCISNQELVLDTAAPFRPRTVFSLQKLLETAEYNVERSLIVWDQLWQHLENHFTRVCAG